MKVRVIDLLNNVPITRNALCDLTGLSDRAVRNEIEKIKQIHPVINVGEGYYIPDDSDDPNLIQYIRSEKTKALVILKNLRTCKQLANVDINQEVIDG